MINIQKSKIENHFFPGKFHDIFIIMLIWDYLKSRSKKIITIELPNIPAFVVQNYFPESDPKHASKM